MKTSLIIAGRQRRFLTPCKRRQANARHTSSKDQRLCRCSRRACASPRLTTGMPDSSSATVPG